MAEYTIKFYRSLEWAKRFQDAGIDKHAGMVVSTVRYTRRSEAQQAVDFINSSGPEWPCEIVVLGR